MVLEGRLRWIKFHFEFSNFFKKSFYDNVGEIEHLDFFWGGGEIVAIFHPPPKKKKKKVSTILAVFVIQGYKLFWRNKSKFVGGKKFFLMGNKNDKKKWF